MDFEIVKKLNEINHFISTFMVKIGIQQNEIDLLDDFLVQLKESDSIQCQKLLVCIGIDIKAISNRFGENNEEIKTYLKNLNKVINEIKQRPISLKSGDWDSVSPSFKFGIKKNLFINEIEIPISVKNSASYARVVSFSSLLRNLIYDNDNFDLNVDIFPVGLSKDDNTKKRILKQLKEGILNFQQFKAKKISQFGKHVFVADLENILEEKSPTLILDKLGFYLSNINTHEFYFIVKYPITDEVFFQPTVFAGDWARVDDMEVIPGNPYFMSFNNLDSWGRTCSVTGICDCYKERVHINSVFEQEYTFDVVKLDNINKIVTQENEDILRTAINRYDYEYEE
jgi:hypothetical protein